MVKRKNPLLDGIVNNLNDWIPSKKEESSWALFVKLIKDWSDMQWSINDLLDFKDKALRDSTESGIKYQLLADDNKTLAEKYEKLAEQEKLVLTVMIWALLVVAVAIVWRLVESILRSYTETVELRTDVLELRLKNEELKNDVEDAKKDNELLIEKKYSEFLKIQLNKK